MQSQYLCEFTAMDIAERLIAFKNHTGLTNSQFADRAGIPRPTLSQFLNGRNKRLSDDLAAKLHVAYPQLNVMWLLFGEGDMVSGSNIEISEGKIGSQTDANASQSADTTESTTDKAPAADDTAIDSNEKKTAESDIFAASDSATAFANPTTIDMPPTQQSANLACAPVIPADPAKKIQSIMVFYSDNSYEIFTPRDTDK